MCCVLHINKKSIKYNYIMEQKHHYTGLTDAQVLESRQRYGVNVLTPPEKETIWDTLKEACTHWISISMFSLVALSAVVAGILVGGMGPIIWSMPAIIALATVLILIVGFFGGFGDPLFKILIMAFVLSMGISIYEYCWVGTGFKTFFEPIGIIVALILATSIAFVLERRNEKTFQSLNVANDDTLVKVIRNNNVCQVPRKDIVVGDIVLLEAGEEIPADCELLQSLNLNVNESSLTGELQCAKTTDETCFDKEATYPSNQIMKGTIILEGYCVAKVTKVGDATESGKVFEAAQVEEGGKTPLSEELDKLADLITYTSYVFAVLIIIGRIGIYFYMGNADFSTGEGWINFVTYVLKTIMIAVTLIVVAVPEGLPMSVTLSLAFSMQKLMKENTLPRTMHSCETMGATSVICTDKTGTLTQNRMQVAGTHLEDISNNLLAEMIAINTTANLDFTDLQVKIVTGDTSGTAKEIGRQIGLWNDTDGERNILTGAEFAALSDEQLVDRVEDVKILSRARPNDKERLVKLLKQKGMVVAATGDGTNDAPALNAADVGLSMGDGTAVAKEASDMTIQDNSFSTIANAVMWGRSLYKNIQRFLLFQLTVNVTACLLVLCGAFMGTESPLTVTQMLWINLIMDTFAAIALASLPPSRKVMEDKPRDRRASILTPTMRKDIIGVGLFFFFLLVAMLYIFEHGDYTSMRELFLNFQLGERDGLSTYELTLLFTTFVMTHFFYLFNARAFETGKSALHFKGCQGLLFIVGVIFGGQVLMVEIPMLQDFFNVTGLKFEDWVIIIVGSSLVLWIREIWSLLKKI